MLIFRSRHSSAVFVCMVLLLTAIVLGTRLTAAVDGPRLWIDASGPGWEINPYIYGINFGPVENTEAYFHELGIPVRRWGGNATTRYNWKLDMTNRASDWFFENLPDSDGVNLPDSSIFNRFHEQNVQMGVETVLTVPIIGWTPKSRQRACGFSVAKYGQQQRTDPWWPDCGNGVLANGQNMTGNDPLDTSAPIGPEFAQEWVAYLKSRYGGSSPGGVRFCELDNEPDCWQWTHRDVFPNPFSYDDVVNRGISHAAAIREADPDIKIMGPVIANWMGYFCSAVDWYSGWRTGPNWVWWGNPIDRNAHEGVPLLRWYLRKMREYEEQHGVRILDYLDIHGYPYEDVGGDVGDAAKQARRLRAVRYYWDPAYPVTGTTEFPGLIPMMRQWIAAEYPGTRLAITEYAFGSLNHINGALVQAETLGVFGRERVDLATMWDMPALTDPGAFAFRIYRNYDGRGASFGDRGVPARSDDPDVLSVFAAVRQTDGALTAVIINKSLQEHETEVSIAGHYLRGSTARVYRYSPADLTSIVRQPDIFLSGVVVPLVVPAQSITLVEFPPGRHPRRRSR